MTTSWMPGPGGNMVVPPGYVDPHSYSGVYAQALSPLSDEPAGTLARTVSRALLSGTIAPASGTEYARMLVLPSGMTVTNIAVCTGGTAAVAPTHFWLELLDPNMNVLAVTADQGSAAITANTFFKIPVTAPIVTPVTGSYYIGLCIAVSTTMPTVLGTSPVAAINNVAPALSGTLGVGQTTPPAVGTSRGTLTATPIGLAAWIS